MRGVLEFDIGLSVLSEYDSDGFPTIQIDAYGEKLSGVEPYEHHSPCGIVARPHDPDTDSDGSPLLGCQVLYADEGGRGHAWVSSDPRVIPLLPQVKKGGFSFYGGLLKNPAYGYIDGDSGSMTFYVPYRIEDDVPQRSLSIEMNVESEGEENISIVHGSGAAVTITEKDGKVSTLIKNQKGDVYLEVNDNGIIANGQFIANGGVSAGGAAGTPVALALPLISLLQQLITIVAAINATTPGLPAAALTNQLAGIKAQFANAV